MNDLNLSKEDLQQIIKTVYNKTDFAKKIGFKFFNGRTLKKVSDIILEYNLDASHFDSSKKNKDRRKYRLEIKLCPVCNSSFETQIGSKEERTTCSYSCSNVYFASERHTKSSNAKTSNSLKFFYETKGLAKKILNKNCKQCSGSFQTCKNTKLFCSKKCVILFNWQNPDYRFNVIKKIKDKVANGTHKGWKSRSKISPSFPEKVTMEILSELSFSLEREFPQGKWFIDFADPLRKIALEIDGKQHELPDRKISDKNKDDYLLSAGWQVHRIKWKRLTKDFREDLKNKIQSIFK